MNADLISSVDFLPTICQAAGIDVPANTDGVSFLPQLRGEKRTPREWLLHLVLVATAAKKEQSALDKFRDARPGELDKQFRDSVKKN